MAEPECAPSDLFDLTKLLEWTLLADEIEEELAGADLVCRFRKALASEASSALSWFKENLPEWRIAFCGCSQLLAVMQRDQLEIRNLRIRRACVKCRVLDDPHPRWRHLLWNRSGTLLVSVRSTPVIDVFDFYGNYCYGIKMENFAGFAVGRCVAALCCEPQEDNPQWSDKLYTLQHFGMFRAYNIGHLNGYQNLFAVDLAEFQPGFFTTLLIDSAKNLVLSSQAFTYSGDALENSSDGSELGMRIWRVIDSPPFLVPFEVFAPRQSVPAINRALLQFSTFLSKKAMVLHTCFNEARTLVACTTTFSDVRILAFPSLQFLRVIRKETEPSCTSFISAHWWSDSDLIISDLSGSVFVRSIDENATNGFVFESCCARLHCCVLTLVYKAQHCFFLEKRSGRTESSQKRQILRLPKRIFKWMASMFLGFATEEVSKTACTITYSLWELVELTAPDLLQKKLAEEDFDGAMDVAERFHLGYDAIYKNLWMNDSIGKNSIAYYLSKITDGPWVLNECLSSLSTEYKDNHELLVFGINYATRCINNGAEYEEARDKLLKYLESLEDYGEIISSLQSDMRSFSCRYYKQLRSNDALSNVVHFARESNYVGIEVMLRRHKPCLYPYWLFILDNISETTPVHSYQHLLPTVESLDATWPSRPRPLPKEVTGASSFPCDDLSYPAELAETVDSFEYKLDLDPPARSQIVEWYKYRAIKIDELTNLPELSLKLLQYAVRHGFKELEGVQIEFQFLCDANYVCQLSSGLTYGMFVTRSFRETTDELLQETRPAKFVARFWNVIVPYIRAYSRHFEMSIDTLVVTFLTSTAERSLACVANVMTSPQAARERIFSNMTALNQVSMLEDCFLAVKGEMNFGECKKMLDVCSENLQQPSSSSLALHRLRELRQLIETMEELEKAVGIHLAFGEFREIRSDDAKSVMFLKALIRLLLGKGCLEQDQLLEMLKFLSSKNYLFFNFGECLKMYAQVLLESKDFSMIRSAYELIQSKSWSEQVAVGDLCALVQDVVSMYVAEAESCADPVLQFASKVIAVVDRKDFIPELSKQWRFLFAVDQLSDLQIKEKPCRLIQVTEKSGWFEAIFASDTAYDHKSEIVEALCTLFPEQLKDIEVQVMVKCAEQAFSARKFQRCLFFCNQFIDQNVTAGWRVCKMLGTSGHISSSHADELLCFALSHCDRQNIRCVLEDIGAYRRAKKKPCQSDDARQHKKRMDKALADSSKPDRLSQFLAVPFFEDLFREPSAEFHSLMNAVRQLFAKHDRSADLEKLNDVLAKLAVEAVHENVNYILVLLLALDDASRAADIFAKAPPSLEVAQCAVLYYMLRIVRPKYIGRVLKAGLAQCYAFAVASGSKTRYSTEIRLWLSSSYRYLCQKITAILPEVNKKSYFSDVQYWHDSMIGMTLTADEKWFNVATELAKYTTFPLRELYASRLEYLMTDFDTDARKLHDLFTKRNWVSWFSKDFDFFVTKLEKEVFPLLSGKDLSKLRLYYMLIEKYSNDKQTKFATANHVTVLEALTKTCKGINYKTLLSADRKDLSCLFPFLEQSNVALVAHAVALIPAKDFREEDVMGIWAVKVFLQCRSQKNITETSVTECWPIIEKLPGDVLLNFAETLVFSPCNSHALPTIEERLVFTRELCRRLKSSKSRDTYADIQAKLGEIDNFLLAIERSTDLLGPALVQHRFYSSLIACSGDMAKVQHFICEVTINDRNFQIAEGLLSAFRTISSQETMAKCAELLTEYLVRSERSTVAILRELWKHDSPLAVYFKQALRDICKEKRLQLDFELLG